MRRAPRLLPRLILAACCNSKRERGCTVAARLSRTWSKFWTRHIGPRNPPLPRRSDTPFHLPRVLQKLRKINIAQSVASERKRNGAILARVTSHVGIGPTGDLNARIIPFVSSCDQY